MRRASLPALLASVSARDDISVRHRRVDFIECGFHARVRYPRAFAAASGNVATLRARSHQDSKLALAWRKTGRSSALTPGHAVICSKHGGVRLPTPFAESSLVASSVKLR